ncbi:MAG: lipid-A-disaccharide synthase [Bdellovibrionaceae bacterium]|nr:lipid-A-disaccharide synthase [Bdellovibrio sp.]
MFVAAEASSAHYALKLIQYWRNQGKDYTYFGVGSNAMEAEGFERIGKSEEMAVVGAAEIFAHFSHLKSVFNQLLEQARIRKPNVVVVMDYPEFNLYLARKLHAMGIKVYYYISPQVWAWRKGRVETIKRFCEKAFLLFPFEVEFYKSRNAPYEFVGHPLLDEFDADLLDPIKIQYQKEKYGIKKTEKLLALMPGSRRGELDQHLEIQLEVARRLLKKYEELRLAIFVAPTIKKEEMLARLENFKSPYILLQDDPNKMISLADYVLVASGTATLMVGLLQKPMVIMYRVKWLTGLFGRMLVKVKYFGLVNLILDKEVVPERKLAEANPDELFKLMDRFIADPTYTRETVEALKKLPLYLGEKGATARVAQALEKHL